MPTTTAPEPLLLPHQHERLALMFEGFTVQGILKLLWLRYLYQTGRIQP